MKKASHVVVIFILLFAILKANGSQAQNSNPEEKLGWQLGAQAWTFHDVTFAEALKKIDSVGLRYVEGFPQQEIGAGIEGKMDFNMSPATIKAVKKLLKQHRIKMISYGVVKPKNHEEWEKLFKFAKAFDLENIVSEPEEADIPFIAQLCDRYKINLAIHNHPNPSHYWNPDIVFNAIKGVSSRVGFCADLGHWPRSGLNALETLKKVEGHVKEFHFKDLNEMGKEAHDVPWGTGINNISAIMQEMKDSGFRGPVMVEYEYDWGHNVPDVKASVAYFRDQADKLLKSGINR